MSNNTTTTTTTSIYNKKASNDVVGGKTARACDSCVKKRARWYCAADDAFLCQSCDHSVHSANSLAKRHERVRLKTASSPIKLTELPSSPTWHRGFTKKARTPRQGKQNNNNNNKPHGSSSGSSGTVPNPFSLVPEYLNSPEEENEDQLLYRVPVYDPFVVASQNAQVSKSTTSFGAANNNNNNLINGFVFPAQEMDDLAEFAADVESLLGHGLENDECFGMKELGFVDSKDETTTTTEESGGVKVEKDQNDDQLLAVGLGGNTSLDDMVMITREPFQFNFDDYDDDVSPAPSCGVEENDENNIIIKEMKNDNGNDVNDVVFDNKKNSSSTSSMMMLIKKNKKMKKQKHQILLRLDYEAVSTAWATQGGSPWTTGDRPDLDPDSCLPDCMMLMSSSCETTQMINDESNNNYLGSGSYVVGVGRLSNTAALGLGLGLGLEEGREARVSRYREKRRTRLFSKKIRYEVRKLNAEKRPRMKGRFVKRSSLTFVNNPPLPITTTTTSFPNKLK